MQILSFSGPGLHFTICIFFQIYLLHMCSDNRQEILSKYVMVIYGGRGGGMLDLGCCDIFLKK